MRDFKVGQIWFNGQRSVEIVAYEEIWSWGEKVAEVIAYRVLGGSVVRIANIEGTTEWKEMDR